MVKKEAIKEIMCGIDILGLYNQYPMSRNRSSTQTYICSGNSYVLVFLLPLAYS